MNEINKYISRIKNPVRREFAKAYASGDFLKVESLRSRLGQMARLSVMLNILNLREGE